MKLYDLKKDYPFLYNFYFLPEKLAFVLQLLPECEVLLGSKALPLIIEAHHYDITAFSYDLNKFGFNGCGTCYWQDDGLLSLEFPIQADISYGHDNCVYCEGTASNPYNNDPCYGCNATGKEKINNQHSSDIAHTLQILFYYFNNYILADMKAIPDSDYDTQSIAILTYCRGGEDGYAIDGNIAPELFDSIRNEDIETLSAKAARNMFEVYKKIENHEATPAWDQGEKEYSFTCNINKNLDFIILRIGGIYNPFIRLYRDSAIQCRNCETPSEQLQLLAGLGTLMDIVYCEKPSEIENTPEIQKAPG